MRKKFEYSLVLGIIIGLIALSLSPFKYNYLLPGVALILGAIITNLGATEVHKYSKKHLSTIMSYAIICTGFGFNIHTILQVGANGIIYTLSTIVFTIGFGLLLGYLLKIEGKTSTLIAMGTAICGGSAIAAISPIIQAKEEQIAVSMSCVFLLNLVALFIFPFLGHQLHFDQTQFGLFSGIAIHDTSSVVASCMSYGAQALFIGTTIKLSRALWIIPIAIVTSLVYNRINHKHAHLNTAKIKKPWFILWFMLAATLVTFVPSLRDFGNHVKEVGTSLFIVSLFLVGCNTSFDSIKSVGIKAIIQGVVLWLSVIIIVVTGINFGLIHL